MTTAAQERPFVRPFALTGGRVTTSTPLPLEALVRTTSTGTRVAPAVTPVLRALLDLAADHVGVVEVAARLAVPIGVCRVLIADLLDEGLVVVAPPASAIGDAGADQVLLERVLDGVRRL